MKTVRLALLALLMLPAAASAQDNAAGSIRPRSSSGDFALLFDLGGLASLALNGFNPSGNDTSAIGAGFGAKYFIADNVALRLGLTLETNNATIPVGSDSAGLNDEQSVLRFAIAPSITYNLVTKGPVAGYVGGQISFAMSNSSRTVADESQPDVEASATTFGVGAIIGGEWFPWSNVSFAAEYILGYGMSTKEEERTVAGTTTRFELPTQTSIGLRTRGVLTAALYW